MRTFLSWLILCAALVLPAHADQTDKRLDRLFNQLAAVRTAGEAAAIEAQINDLWLKSGSDTVDVLMGRAEAAMAAQDVATAKKLLDSVAEMKPDYAEVWYRRAELLLSMDSQQEAEADLAQAIDLEPRHFKALAIAGRLAEAAGNKNAALAAYRRAATLNPMMEAIGRRALQLEEETERKPPPI
jgi:tetratricopeptide (TPR) repeat protein